MNKPREKGTMAESAVVGHLRENGFPYAERRSLKGSLDQGDVTGTPGLCWEVKYANGGLRLGTWMAETALEKLNSFAEHAILVVKPPSLGVKSVPWWYAIMPLMEHEQLLAQTGHPQEFVRPMPFTFTAGNLKVAMVLAEQARDRVNPGLMFAVTAIPPGAKYLPSRQYRVMYLEEMVRLVRQAGYGTPVHEDATGVSRE
jgi:hypothetical protein